MDNPLGILPPGLENLSIAAQQKAATGANKKLGQDTFLELMIAQLKNQDPMKPMESGDFLAQIAQFTTASGVGELNDSFNTLAGALQSNQALQASTLVGRNVLVPSQIAVLTPGTPVQGTIDLPRAAGLVSLSVYDSAGQLVRQMSLGAQTAGTSQFSWDGLDDAGAAVPAGRYRIAIEAESGNETLSLQPYLPARVESVSLRSGGAPQLNLTGLGTVGLDEVRQVM
ncbi:MAG: flagellar hook assembly protein FlgD [Gammaproteobacteria bacterium]|nr:flagellar hook assembly protein FlgD [Gammaproteobacteria bacterium]